MVKDAQVRRLKRLSKIEKTQEVAAAKAGMDVKTARKYLASGKQPSEEKPERTWRTRLDPFVRVRKEVEEQIDAYPGLEAKTIFEALQRKYPGEFADGQLRTLQRHLKRWRATAGPGREVFYSQHHVPGRLGQSDFTYMNELAITIGGQSFPHLLYHFRADLLELGGRHALLFGELREPERRYAERFLGTWRRAAEAPDRSALHGGEQHVGCEGVHQPLRSAAAALPDGRREDPGGQSERERRHRAAPPSFKGA